MLRGQLAYKGERGYSAYEIAVQNGYTGTEEEWANAFLSADYYYTKTEANALLATKANITDVYTKGDYAIITGEITNPDEASQITVSNISFPEGFDIDNCIVLNVSFERTLAGGVRHWATGSRFTLNSPISGAIAWDIVFNNDNFSLTIRSIQLREFDEELPNSPQVRVNPIGDCRYKVVLMKIGIGE